MPVNTQDYIDAVKVHCQRRVRVKDRAGVFHDLTKYMATVNYEGDDLLDNWSWGMDVDEPITQLSVTLGGVARDENCQQINLAPLKEPTSPLFADNVTEIFLEHRFSIDGQIQDWANEWNGYIDSVVHASDGYTITLQCRDPSKLYANKFIHRPEDQRIYGLPGGEPAEDVMDNILTDEGFGPIIVPTSPAFVIEEYRQEKVTVLEALARIADNFAWIVRALPNPLNNNLWELTLHDPPRGKTVPDYVFTEDSFASVSNSTISDIDVRNSIEPISLNRLANDNNQPITTLVTSPASIATFGERHMEIFLDERSLIDTSAEAIDLATRVVNDLANPKADFQAVLNFPFPQIMIGDLVTISNTRFFQNDENLAVVGFSHTPTQTTIQLKRGAPVGMTHGWLDGRRLESGRDPQGNIRPAYKEATVIAPTSVVLVTALEADAQTARLEVSWAIVPWHASDFYEVRYKIQGATEWEYTAYVQENNVKIHRVATGATYCVGVRAISRDNVNSDWTPDVCNATPLDTTPTGPVTALACATIVSGVKVSWNRPSDVDYANSRVYAATTNPPAIPADFVGSGFDSFEVEALAGGAPVPNSTTIFARVVPYDFSGNSGPISAVTSCTSGRFANNSMALPTGVDSATNTTLVSGVTQTIATKQLLGAKINDSLIVHCDVAIRATDTSAAGVAFHWSLFLQFTGGSGAVRSTTIIRNWLANTAPSLERFQIPISDLFTCLVNDPTVNLDATLTISSGAGSLITQAYLRVHIVSAN